MFVRITRIVDNSKSSIYLQRPIHFNKTLLQITPKIDGFKCRNKINGIIFERKTFCTCLKDLTSFSKIFPIKQFRYIYTGF